MKESYKKGLTIHLSRELSWDIQYRLTQVAVDGTPVETYGYDPLGRRAWTHSTGSGQAGDGSVTNWHVYDGMHCIADVDNSGTNRTYTWGPGIDNLLAITDHSASETNTYYAITDHLGTVHALADDNGNIVESYKYDAWGNILEVRDANGLLSKVNGLWSSPLGNRFLFQGREYSWATGLYNFRARWYDPVTGRWLSKDPIGISGGLNQYVAFENNPVNFRDPYGHSIISLWNAATSFFNGPAQYYWDWYDNVISPIWDQYGEDITDEIANWVDNTTDKISDWWDSVQGPGCSSGGSFQDAVDEFNYYNSGSEKAIYDFQQKILGL